MRTKKFLSSLLIGSMLLTAIPAYAVPPASQPSTVTAPVTLPASPDLIAGEIDVGAAVSPMKKNQIAPFTGVLLSPKAVATVTVNLNSINDQVKIDVDHANAIAKVQCLAATNEVQIKADTDAKVATAKLDAALAENKIITDRMTKDETSRPNLVLWVSGGILGGIVISLATTYAVTRVTK